VMVPETGVWLKLLGTINNQHPSNSKYLVFMAVTFDLI